MVIRLKTINLIGTGHVAWNLAQAFQLNGVHLGLVWSRTFDHALAFAGEFNATPAKFLQELSSSDGLTLICVPDHAIMEVIELGEDAGLSSIVICHTSGATSLDVFPSHWRHASVFYPLQTLTKGHARDFSDIPILLSSRNVSDQELLVAYGQSLSKTVSIVEDQERQRLHMAAVMVNNFVYHLVDKAFGEIERHGLNPGYLHPLLEETVRKVIEHRGERVQTGPAIRGDKNSILTHLHLLANNPALAGLYRRLSLSINPELDI